MYKLTITVKNGDHVWPIQREALLYGAQVLIERPEHPDHPETAHNIKTEHY